MKIKRILLISPDPVGDAKKQFKPPFPPLGLMQVAALTPPKYDVRLVDESVESVPLDYPADLVAISVTMSSVYPRACWLASQFQQRHRQVVFGGVHPSFCPQRCLNFADYVFRFEAEGGWSDFLELLEQGQAPEIFTAQPRFPSLDDIPNPRRDLLRPRDYAFFNTVQTARGCGNHCDFCSVWMFSGQNLRFRSISHTVAEIAELPPGPVIFVDDNIISNRDYAEELFRALIPLRRAWFAQTDISLLERPDLVKLAAKSGCAVLFVGFESFNPAALDEAEKPVNNPENYPSFVESAHRHGIAVIAANIRGWDCDTAENFGQTTRELNRLKVDGAQFSILTPLPGTRLYHRMQKEGRLREPIDFSLFNGGHQVFDSPLDLEQELRVMYRYYRLRSIVWRLVSDPWFWRHPLRRLNFYRLLWPVFGPRIWAWIKRKP